MDKNKQKAINKNNRKRGGAFEKRGADFLDMDVVPYSGSNARFGYGDVRDSIWLGEFKNITPVNSKVTIKVEDWIEKNIQRAVDIKHLPFLAWMPAGSPDKFVILDYETSLKLQPIDIAKHIDLDAKFNTKNLIIDIDSGWMKQARKSDIIEITLRDRYFYIMSMAKFKDLINDRGMKGRRSVM